MPLVKWNSLQFLSIFIRFSPLLLKNFCSLKIMLICVENTFEWRIKWHWNANIRRLGAVHDGSPPPSYLGGPGAEKCRWEDGYIMSDLRHTEKGFKWSHCSVSSFHHFLKYDSFSWFTNLSVVCYFKSSSSNWRKKRREIHSDKSGDFKHTSRSKYSPKTSISKW